MKYQLAVVHASSENDMISKLVAYEATRVSGTKTELGIPTGMAAMTPARTGFALREKCDIPATVVPPIKNCPNVLWMKFLTVFIVLQIGAIKTTAFHSHAVSAVDPSVETASFYATSNAFSCGEAWRRAEV